MAVKLQSAFAKLSPGRAAKLGGFSTVGGVHGPALGALSVAGAAPDPAAALAAGAPPAAAVMPLAPLPNPAMDASINAADRDLATTLQQNQAARGQLGGTYGFGVDGSGGVIDDHSNPWSRAAALQTAHDQAVRGTNNSYAARGQLYSGAIQNAQNYNATQNLKGRDALIREFMNARQSLDNRDLGAKNAYQTAVENAKASNAMYQLANPPAAASIPDAAPGPDMAAAIAAQLALQAGNQQAAKPYKVVAGKGGNWHVYPDGRRVWVKG